MPLIEEAWDLLNKIKERQAEIEKQIDLLEDDNSEEARKKRKLETDLKIFKSIMCPLGENCPKDKRLRWPSTNIKCTTQFGKECLFAHNVNEIFFKEYTYATGKVKGKIDNLQKKQAIENPSKPWVANGVVGGSHNKLIKEDKGKRQEEENKFKRP